MEKRFVFSLALVIALTLVMAACSKKTEETAEQPAESTTAVQPTPIDQSTVGEVTGKVSFDGAKPKPHRIMMDQDPVCVKKHNGAVFAEDDEVNSNNTLPNVFVYVKAGAEKYVFTPPSDPVTLDQDGCMYKPHVLGIMVGQTLNIVSSDATTHNIHPMPKDNREWNMSQPPGAAPIEQKFAREEVMIPVKCNQHPWMRAYIGVLKTPFYAVTGSDGTYTIKGLPPGDYTIGAWTAMGAVGGQTQEQKVTVGAKETKTVDFSFKG
ncbi:MAG: carboxypeptidase regulatory-like domain-containing protein [Terriglobia bacterium]